ncbi:MAG: mechanosensitive ion channel [Phocaeicola sp.]|nr:mechanosensitive ion channel [Phocaeicola sp.]
MLLTLLNVALNATSKINVEAIIDKLVNLGIEAGKDLISAVIIYVIGRFIIKQINRLVSAVLVKRKLEVSVQTFLKSFLSITLNMILAFAIIARLGVETTSFAAILASAGVAIGMALSGNLSNFAGGLIILVFKPFKVGDYIDGPSGSSGTVKEIQIFHTILATTDNKIIYVPNGAMSSNAIVNYSKQESRRAEWVFGVEYGEDYEKVKAVLERIINEDERILKDPAPFIGLGSLSASSVDIKVRVWTKTSDYWDVYFDMNKKVYDTFNKEGIGFPFPQLTVHQAEK